MTRFQFLGGVALLLGACGGDSTEPDDDEDAFPNVGGTYELDATFDDLPSSIANVTGTLTIDQPSRAVGTLSGSADLTLSIDGEVSHDVLAFSTATVTPAGTVSFTLADGSAATWTFSGTATSLRITGRHTLGDGIDSFSGDFVAVRSGSSTRQAGFARGGVELDAAASVPSELSQSMTRLRAQPKVKVVVPGS